MRLPFFDIAIRSDAPALIWRRSLAFRYGDLIKHVTVWQKKLEAPTKKLVFFFSGNAPHDVAALIGALSAGHAVALLDTQLAPGARGVLQERYQPWAILTSRQGEGSDPDLVFCSSDKTTSSGAIHPDLALLLSTSGSTGSPKFVRLSKTTLVENALAIADVLKISSDDIASGHLDLHYSYGLSVLTSHLVKGAAIAFTLGKFTDRDFWNDTRIAGVTHLPGVPFHYKMMARLGFERLKLPALKSMTQAGGPLAPAIKQQAYDFMQAAGGKFSVMYGQTEAAPRMSTLQHEEYAARPASVGKALPLGQFNIVDETGDDCAPGTSGQIIYRGPNVMMGYATRKEDLAGPDENHGILPTGDTGYLDQDGYLFVTGRGVRMGKIYGWRISLDEIESAAQEFGAVAVVQAGEKVVLASRQADALDAGPLLAHLGRAFSLPISVYRHVALESIPKNHRKKTDYGELKKIIEDADADS